MGAEHASASGRGDGPGAAGDGRPRRKGTGQRNRDHRIAHPPQSARPRRSARLPRPVRHPEDRPQLGQRRPPAAAQRRRRTQLTLQQLRQPRQSAGWRGRRRRRGADRLALPWRGPHPGARRWPALRQRRVGERRSGRGRPQCYPRRDDRPHRGAAGRRFVDLRFRRHLRRRQHHHQVAPAGLCRLGASRQLSRP